VKAACYPPGVSDSALAPRLLVAMPQLLDPNFHRAVVLIVHHDDSGTFGVILNRPTEITAPNLCASLEIDWHGDPADPIDWGGPVQPQTGWVLFARDPGIPEREEVQEVGEGVCFAGSLDVLRHVANDPPENVRLMLGYAGWGPGQLESELSEGAWLVAPVSRQVVFDVGAPEMWEFVVRSLGVDPATLVPTRGIH
jgi:putative transcriptional regulator